MKIKTITTTSDRAKCFNLERSLKYYGYDYHIIEHEWRGFLSKLHETYLYLKTLEGYTHFAYTDAWDTVALAPEKELYQKMPKTGFLISAERACYPYTEWESRYPKNDSPWHFVNGGGWGGEIAAFLKLYDSAPPTVEINDQVWMTERFLTPGNTSTLDYDCSIFQTMGFNPEDNFEYLQHRIVNKVTGQLPIFVHGNGHTDITAAVKLLPSDMDTLAQAAALWYDSPDAHRLINEGFNDKVNATPKLKQLRDYVEQTAYGFGERSFYWMWKLLFDEMPKNPSILEIGVYRGQTLALFRILGRKWATITGITPLDKTGGFHESNYEKDISDLHDKFKLKQPEIIRGLSTYPAIISQVGKQAYDIIYIDGGHEYEIAKSDIYQYSSFVKIGGYLVIDDSGNRYNMPEGYFRGIESVSRAVDELLPNEHYKEIISVVHNRVFKRIK